MEKRREADVDEMTEKVLRNRVALTACLDRDIRDGEREMRKKITGRGRLS